MNSRILHHIPPDPITVCSVFILPVLPPPWLHWPSDSAAALFFPALILGIFDKKINKEGAVAGMVVGIALCYFT